MAIDPEVAEAINLMWIFVAGIFCFLLQAGGFCRALAPNVFSAAPREELCRQSSTRVLPNAVLRVGKAS